jgi:ribose 5-phosphate isomerase B
MKLAIVFDHAGFALRQEMVHFISRIGHIVVDLGANNAEPSDYLDFAAAVGCALIESTVERGVLICGSRVVVCVTANKMLGIRAAICRDT